MRTAALVLPFGLAFQSINCIRLPSQPFMPEISQEVLNNYKYQSYHQWPQPMESQYLVIQQQMNHRHLVPMAPLDIGLAFARQFLSSFQNTTDFIVKNFYKTDFNNVTHIYLRQTVNDVEVCILIILLVLLILCLRYRTLP